MALTKVSYSMIEGASANVLDFGAVGDGIADDTSAIQDAIDSSLAVYFPEGVYKITQPVNLQSQSRLFGAGYKSRILETAGGIIVGTDLSDVIIENLQVEIDASKSVATIIRLNNCDNSLVSGLSLVGLSSAATGTLSVFGGQNNLIDSVVGLYAAIFLSANNGDVVSPPASPNDWGRGNRITRCSVRLAAQGIACLWQQDVVVAFNTVSGSSTAFGCGILIEAGNNGAKVIGNVCNSNVRSGFYVEGAAPPYSVQGAQFIGNVANGNGEAGITLSTRYKDIRVIGGTYNSNTGSFPGGDADGAGVYMETAGDSVSITDATMIGNNNAGIVSFQQTGLLTRDNVIESSPYAHVTLGTHTSCNFGRLFSAAISIAKYNTVSYASGNRYDDASVLSTNAVSTVNPITLGTGGSAITRWSVKTTGDVYVQLRIDLGTGFSIPPGSIQFTLAETGFTVPNRAMSTVVVIANTAYKMATTRVLPGTSVLLAFESAPTWIAGDSIDVQLQWNVFNQS